jgi:GGDEF domain-containing protein
MQVWDDRRIAEGEEQLKYFVDAKAAIETEKTNIEKRLQTATFSLENMKEDYNESERMRRLDLITGVPNYLAWEADLTEWTRTGKRDSLSLILIDIDKLKWLNERSRECADLVLRYFAQSTINSMRRDEQMYKAPTKMYRHYQGGDEFYFAVSGSVFDAVGFANRLADRVRVYEPVIRETILSRYLTGTDVEAFRLSFSGAVIGPGKLSLTDAYEVLDRAKRSGKSRLLVVIDSTYEEPSGHREKLEKMRENLRRTLVALQQKADGGDEDSKVLHQTLLKDESKLDTNTNILKKAEQIFAV